MKTIQLIKEHLEQFGVKPSLQRIEVMKYLLNNKNHPTADMIYNELNPRMPTLSKTTIYNTLKLLADQGVVQSLNIDEKNVRYDGDLSVHAHFRCKNCGKILDIPFGEQAAIERPDLTTADSFQVTECQIYYKGYCNDCRED